MVLRMCLTSRAAVWRLRLRRAHSAYRRAEDGSWPTQPQRRAMVAEFQANLLLAPVVWV